MKYYLILVQAEPYVVIGGRPYTEVLGPFDSDEAVNEALSHQGLSTWLKVQAVSEIQMCFDVKV